MSEPTSMRKVREILRLKHGCGRSQREIAASLQIAVGTVHGYLKRAQAAGLSWADAESLSDVEVEARLFRDQTDRNMPTARVPIDFSHVHSELRRKHVTLQLLWAEYQESALARCDGSKPYQYSQFCELYGAWRVRLAPSMRRVHLAGERAFIDYSAASRGPSVSEKLSPLPSRVERQA
jgi:transposase